MTMTLKTRPKGKLYAVAWKDPRPWRTATRTVQLGHVRGRTEDEAKAAFENIRPKGIVDMADVSFARCVK